LPRAVEAATIKADDTKAAMGEPSAENEKISRHWPIPHEEKMATLRSRCWATHRATSDESKPEDYITESTYDQK